MKKLVLLICLLVAPILLFGATKIITVKVDGFGITKDDAIQNGLIEAVKQANGVSIDSKKIFSKKIKQNSSSQNGKYSSKASLSKNNISRVKEATKGLIEEYRVISSQKKSSDEWKVKLVVKMLKYKEVGLSSKNRRKLAIIPFEYGHKYFCIGSRQYEKTEIIIMLQQALVTDVTQSRRFAVLDRKFGREMAKELKLLNSNLTPASEKTKLGQILGADYLLVGVVRTANVNSKTTNNQLLGTSKTDNKVEFVIDYRIVVVGTSQTKWSETVFLTVDLNGQDSEDVMLNRAVKQVSTKITNQLLSNIYPLKVASITSSGSIVLNQGGSLVKKGMHLKVYKLGDRIIDPYTKESLGREEIEVGKVVVTKVTPKVSYVKVDGKSFNVKKGYICRAEQVTQIVSKEVDNKNWKKTTVQVNSGGGVKLSF